MIEPITDGGLRPIQGGLRNHLRRLLKQLPTHDELDRAGTVRNRLRIICGGETTLLAIAANTRGLSVLAFSADANGQLPPDADLRWYIFAQATGLPLVVVAQDDIEACGEEPRPVVVRAIGTIIPETKVTDPAEPKATEEETSSFDLQKLFDESSSPSREWQASDVGSGKGHSLSRAVSDLADFLKRGGKPS